MLKHLLRLRATLPRYQTTSADEVRDLRDWIEACKHVAANAQERGEAWETLTQHLQAAARSSAGLPLPVRGALQRSASVSAGIATYYQSRVSLWEEIRGDTEARLAAKTRLRSIS